MASAQKPTGARRRTTTRAKKPATIDLKATEVKPEAQDKTTKAAGAPDEAKTAAATAAKSDNVTKSDQKFGRDAAKSSDGKQEPKPAAPKPTGNDAKKDARSSASNVKSNQTKSSSGGGMGSGLLGGLLGSVTTVLGLGVIGQMDSAPNIPLIGSLYENGSTQTNNEVSELLARLEALEASGTNASVNLAPIEERLAELESAPQQADTDNNAAIGVLKEELATLSQSVNSILNAVDEGGDATTTEVAASLAAVVARLDKIETDVSQPAQADNSQLEAAFSKIAALETAISDVSQLENVDVSAIEKQIADVQANISALNETVTSNSQGVETLNSQSSQFQETLASVKQSEKVARSVAVNALGTALENDDPLALALASVKSLIGETAETQRLGELEEKGIPSRKDLLAELDRFINSVQNPKIDASNGSVSEKFWANLQNLVTFRASGPLEGDGVVPILSRLKNNLENGDLSGLLAEWQKLPADVQSSGESFRSNVETRQEAHNIFEALNAALADKAS